MDAERQRIEADLRGQLAGSVRCDDLYVQLYASDASIYEIAPLGVVRPRTLADVVATVRYAAANKIPLHARGAGSGLTGGALGRGLVVDFSRYMRRILKLTDDTVRVQSGVVLADLNRLLARRERVFGPDPANIQVTTMGSVVAVDGGGSRWLTYGSARQHVESLEVVLASGDVVRVGRHDLSVLEESPLTPLVSGVSNTVARFESQILAHKPRSLVNCCGYRLDDVREDGHINLARLFTGSEGTLGLITEATLTTSPLPAAVGSALVFFDSLEKAAIAVQELLPLGPSACDMMDRRHLSLARENDPRYELMIPQVAEAVLLVEFFGETAGEVQYRVESAVSLLVEKQKLASGAHVALDDFDHELLWQLARRYVPTLYRLRGSTRPVPMVEDIAVPPEALPDFLRRAQQILKQLQVTASLFGHAGHGQLHIRPFLDLANDNDMNTLDALAEQLYREVWEVGGTISGEHGDGLSRTAFVAEQYGPAAAAFAEVKQLFDPEQILNPGKIVPLATDDPWTHLRRVTVEGTEAGTVPAANEPPTVALQLEWRPEEMAHAARTCNGCAACRTVSAETRMCPIFRYAPREEASPRSKANLVRGVLTGTLPAGTLVDDACKEMADLCVHCHMCRLECPANVDIPKLMVEAKAAYVATNNEALPDWLLSRIDRLCATASRFSRVANWAIANRPARWLLEKTLGIAQGRKLPRFAGRPFLRASTQRRLNRPHRSAGEKVLYFVDTYANFCDTQLAEALVAVLEHNGVSVYVPERQQQAGMPMIARGVLEPARRAAEVNVALLAEAVRQGYAIVTTEPSAALALTHEYPILLAGDPDAELVAENSFEACHYLWRLHQRGTLELDFTPLNLTVGYHTPCHLRALEVGTPGENLLGLVPGLRVERLEKGCSGMAGLYGFQHKYYRNSLRAGLPLLTAVRTGSFQLGATECSTCKVQMEQGNTKPTIHPVKLVALAYGLMPELRQLVNSTSGDLVVT